MRPFSCHFLSRALFFFLVCLFNCCLYVFLFIYLFVWFSGSLSQQTCLPKTLTRFLVDLPNRIDKRDYRGSKVKKKIIRKI